MTKITVKTAAVGFCLAAVACDSPLSSLGRPTPVGGADATLGGAAAKGDTPVSTAQPVVRFSDWAQVGSSRLVRTPNGITFHVSTTDLTPGHAYTLWFVAFNEPAHCAIPNECGPDDVVNAAAQPDMMYAAGRVVGGAGTATFAGHVRVGDTSGSINAPVGLPSYGLLDPLGAEIHLAVHDHGPKLAEHMPDMIQTIDGGCTDAGIPEAGAMSPWNQHRFGSAGPNACATIQAVVHRP